nr:hypothetical protein [Tanacetum cinerariifolium]
MTSLTSMCEMACQIIQKKQEEKRIEEEQAANAQYWKIPDCCDDDDDYNSVITPNEPVDSLSMGDEHLNTILATESNEFIKSCVENIVPNPSPIVEPPTTPRRHLNRKHSKQQVDLKIVENPVVTMVDQRTMAELLQAPTEGYRDAIVILTIGER